ncbi:hypothetical protein RJ640_021670, partial [Escallonia rubra]
MAEWRLQSGQYLGEISALCFVHLPSHLFSSSPPYLLAERCLLYSMRMSGDKVEALRIASGTINNENPAPCSKRPVEDHNSMTSSLDVGLRLHAQHYRAVPICRLGGHEGSIFRIAWSSNGLKLLSVSDDRCARIWEVLAERQGLDNPADNAVSHSVGPVLFGHSARVWDCCISDSLLITAGEDCTCRIWGQDGTQLKLIKENIGRGVWRCLYDPKSSLLVTAGFDSAIKVHQLHASLSKDLNTCTEVIEELIDKKEIFTLRIPNSSEHIGLVDSKSEYVRCLQFTHEDVLYVATNNGYLYHAKISDTGDVKWTELLRVSEEVPIVCMNLLPRSPFGLSCVDDWVAVGDGKGNMTVVRVVGDVWSPKAGLTFTWSAERERQLLGTFWCKSLGYRFIFTADPRGAVKLWRLCDPSHSVSQKCRNGCIVSLVSEFISCFPIRIMCLDASFQDEVLVCGDLRGNLMLFPLSRSLLTDTSISEAKISPMTYFKGAHGISSVCSVSIASSTNSSIEIHSTGGDGCICYMEYVRDQQKLEFIGMKQVKELSLVRSLFAHSYDDLASGNYAIGFASADFIIWNLVTETKVVQIPCGGWRRPHSYYIGDILEMKNCFAFVKDETIYVHKHWLPDSDRKICYPNLHLQFHGREIHSLCFISDELHFSSDEHQRLYCRSSWIATGCEDGTVRLTRYTPGIENWSASKLLGEHVGGSAVRSICSISKMHILAADLTNMPCETFIKDTTLEGWENPFLLISVGAKRVLTAWKQKRNMRTLADGLNDAIRNDFHPSMSFQWLSTDMPTKRCSNHETRKNMQNACLSDTSENDWRYLAVTAFLVKFADSRFDVALLVPLASPVLSLQHVIIPEPQ